MIIVHIFFKQLFEQIFFLEFLDKNNKEDAFFYSKKHKSKVFGHIYHKSFFQTTKSLYCYYKKKLMCMSKYYLFMFVTIKKLSNKKIK